MVSRCQVHVFWVIGFAHGHRACCWCVVWFSGWWSPGVRCMFVWWLVTPMSIGHVADVSYCLSLTVSRCVVFVFLVISFAYVYRACGWCLVWFQLDGLQVSGACKPCWSSICRLNRELNWRLRWLQWLRVQYSNDQSNLLSQLHEHCQHKCDGHYLFGSFHACKKL